MPRMDEQDQELVLSYGPEDAFTLHRYHCPPRSSTGGLGAASGPAPSAQPLDPLRRPARDITWLYSPIRARQLRRYVGSFLDRRTIDRQNR